MKNVDPYKTNIDIGNPYGRPEVLVFAKGGPGEIRECDSGVRQQSTPVWSNGLIVGRVASGRSWWA